jgi:predicted nuclease of restriction endonuclease-like (RecB) superfamily
MSSDVPAAPRLPVRHDAGAGAGVAGTAVYRELIDRLRGRIRKSQARAARVVNEELVLLYWSIGRDILEQQRRAGWGDDVVGQIAHDLVLQSGSGRGFSRRNLFYMRRFAALWPERKRVQTVSAQIGWSHHQVLIDACGEDRDLYAWYAAMAAAQRWSVRYLKGQIDLALHERLGAAVTNFHVALAPADAHRALATVKDPYVFDFLELSEDARERQLEQALIDDVQRFLLELGSGFAFYGRQRSLLIGRQEFFLDLLFYHHTIRRFVVIELKIGPFQAEYVSKMNLYLGAIDEQLRRGDDRESVGIILCTERDETVAELALRRVYAPIAVSTWRSSAPAPRLMSGASSPEVPVDLVELTQLDEVRARLVERVAQRVPALRGGPGTSSSRAP